MTYEHGESRHSAKLTEAIVREIREHSAAGRTTRALADDYGVSHVAIQKVVTRKTWKHVA